MSHGDRTQRPYGLWDSPVSVADVTAGIGLRSPLYDSDGTTLVWLERRGADSVLLARRRSEVAARQLAEGHKVSSRVFYGGGEFTVGGGRLVFVDGGTRLCAQGLDGGPVRPLTPSFGNPASPALSRNGRWVAYVHSDGGTDRIAVVGTDRDQWPQWLSEGADFYMQPTWHPSGRQLAWIEWDFPNMAWDGTRLMLADLRQPSQGSPTISDVHVIAGNDDVAVFQPEFSSDGRWLAYAADSDGDVSHLYLRDLASGDTRCLTEGVGDVAMPGWVQGMRTFAFSGDSRRLYYTRAIGGERRAWVCDLDSFDSEAVEALADYPRVSHVAAAARGDDLALIATTPHTPDRIVTLRGGSRPTVQARSGNEAHSADVLSTPRPVEWTADNGDTVHGIYYPPTSAHFTADGPPPMLVYVHGGPTAQADVGYDAEVQYFVTRGWAMLLVNHRGSVGHGRGYMTALRGQWGVVDVEDTINGARAMVEQQLADGDRLVITGGSAGGYTVLRSLTAHPGVFRAGVCRYGISNLFSLVETTHKFESRYNDTLLGTLPEAAATWRERSPINHVDTMTDPVIIFQGDEDEVVTRDQSDAIVASLQRRGIPHEYHLFEGEGHGFRRPETKQTYLRATEAFLRRHVLFA